MRYAYLLMLHVLALLPLRGQDTFSIVAVDSLTGEVGAAGASCVDLFAFGFSDPGFLAELFPGEGAIAAQASYLPANQTNARNRFLAGDNPSQIINWLIGNDVAANPAVRQYGVVRLTPQGPQAAAHTGANCIAYKNHVTGITYAIQGNILLNQGILDSMEARFLNTPGDLACKLMAAMQGARVVGADTRCAPYETSSLFAFLKVSQPQDAFGAPSLNLGVRLTAQSGVEPIDSLQSLFNQAQECSTSSVYPLNPSTSITGCRIWPNPAGASLHLEMHHPEPEVHYVLRDTQGSLLRQGQFQGQTVLDTRGIVPGVYLLELRQGQQTGSYTVVFE